MATIARVRRSHILSLTAALVLAPPALALPAGSAVPPSIKDVVKAGDVVAVTRWSGAKIKGHVVAATECALVLRADGRTLGIETGAVKTVRRYPSPTRHAKATLAAVERCGRIECTPGTLAVVGLAGLVKGFKEAGRRPEVIYRAPARAEARAGGAARACPK